MQVFLGIITDSFLTSHRRTPGPAEATQMHAQLVVREGGVLWGVVRAAVAGVTELSVVTVPASF